MKQTLKMPFMTFLMLRYVECRKAQETIYLFLFSPSLRNNRNGHREVLLYRGVSFSGF